MNSDCHQAQALLHGHVLHIRHLRQNYAINGQAGEHEIADGKAAALRSKVSWPSH